MIGLLQLREAIAEIMFVFDVALSIILVRYLWSVSHTYPKQWWRLRHVQGAAAFLTLVLGHAVIRGWSTVTYIGLRHGLSIFDLENKWPIALIGAVIAVVGICWCIRLFAAYAWQERAWMLSVVAAILFTLVCQQL